MDEIHAGDTVIFSTQAGKTSVKVLEFYMIFGGIMMVIRHTGPRGEREGSISLQNFMDWLKESSYTVEKAGIK
jgi:hypothetical protein